MIAKGCTCKNTFSIPFIESQIKDIIITYKQGDAIILEKKKNDCTFNDCSVSVDLTQEESMKFDETKIIRMQIKIKTDKDIVIKSNIMETYTDELFNKVVM